MKTPIARQAITRLKTLALTALLFGTSNLPISHAAESCPIPELPSQFSANERFFTLGTKLNLQAPNGRSIGAVNQEVFKWATTFDYLDAHGKRVARGQRRLFSWGATVDIFDCNNQRIGTVREDISNSLFGVVTVYKVLDATGKEVGSSRKDEWLSTKFTIRDAKGRPVVTMERPCIRLGDSWSVKVGTQDGIDPRVIMMIPAFKTASDNSKSSSASLSDPNRVNGGKSPLMPAQMNSRELVQQASVLDSSAPKGVTISGVHRSRIGGQNAATAL